MKRSDVAGMWSAFLVIAGFAVFLLLGLGVGAERITDDNDKAQTVMTTTGSGFNWLLATIGMAPFVLGAIIVLVAKWLLAAHEDELTVLRAAAGLDTPVESFDPLPDL